MMLELLLTRTEDRELLRAAQGLRFLVFDELHTYRGRQGADIAMLIRRCRHAVGNSVVCIGTSATMTTGGGSDEQRRDVAAVSQSLFGVPIAPEQVVTESLERATPEIDTADPYRFGPRIRAAVVADEDPPAEYETFRTHPLASWIESTFGLREESNTGRLLRQTPRRLQGDPIGDVPSAAAALAALAESDPERCAKALRRWLLRGSSLYQSESSRFSIFAFRLHQFLTRGDTVWASLEAEADRHLEIAKTAAKPGEPDTPLFPLVFCRRCGTAYYRVRVAADDEGTGGCCLARTVGSRRATGRMTRTCISPRTCPGLGPLAVSCSAACRTLSRRPPPRARNGSVPTPAGTFRSWCSSPLPGE